MKSEKHTYFCNGWRLFWPSLLWMALCVLGAWFFPRYFHVADPSVAGFRLLIGWALIGFGLGLFLWGLWHMVWAVRHGLLDTTGPYAMVRHPMYSALILFLFPGIAIAAGIWPMLGTSLVAWFFFHRYAPREEAVLIELFGTTYEAYKMNVPALIPRIPSRK